MTTPELCPKCGKRLPEDAPTGLCPSCLLAAALLLPEPDAGKDRILTGRALDGADKSRVGDSGNIPDRFLSPTTPGTAKFVPPAPAALAPLFPQLEILGLLGHGGMGAVYKARQKKLDRLVALKIIRPEAAADPAFAERFNREARTLARLSHPHIVAVHDFGEIVADDGRTGAASTPVFYFLMEYVDGANLRQLMDGRRLPSNQALAIVPQVCEALQFAHDEGVVHRDIKPENILIDSKGRVKIADFGLAKLVAGSAEEFTLTGTHQIMGTPRYMAPEQMEGSHSVDHRADIYSLGVVFYEMLTGQVPAGHFDPPSKKAETDPKLDAIVLRAMAREPERRFQQASHLGSEVHLARAGDGTSGSIGSLHSSGVPGSTVATPALSSFLSHEARAAYRWVAGADDQSSKNTTGPRLLMLLLSLIPCAMVFFPWFEVYVTDPDATRGLEQTQIIPYKTGIAFYREYSPLELPAGMFFGAAVCMLIVSSGIAFGRRVSTVTAACIGLVLCSAPLALAMAVRANLEYSVITVFRDPATNEMPQGVLGYSNNVGTATLAWIEHTVQYRLPFMVTVGCLFFLLCLLGIELRYAVERRNQEPRERRIPNPLTTVAWWLIAGAVILAISAAASSLYFLDDPYVFDNAIRSQSEVTTAVIGLTGQFLCFPIFVLALLAANSLRHGHHGKLAVAACAAFLIPVTPGWFLTMPIGAWCLSVLLRKEIAASFEEKAETAAPASPTSRPPFPWGDFASGLLVLLSVMGLILFAQVWTDSVWVLCSLFVVWFGIGYAEGEEFKKKTLNGAADWIAGIALPLTFGLIAYGIYQTNSAWPLVSLFAVFVGVGAGYGNATEDETDEETEVAPKVNSVSAAAPISATGTEERGSDESLHVPEAELVSPREEAPAHSVSGSERSPVQKASNKWWAVFLMVSAVTILCILLVQSPLLISAWTQTVSGESPTALEELLHSAIEADDIDRLKQWLSPGTPINQRDSTGRTPLELAIIAGRERIVAFLVLRGGDTLQCDAQGKMPLMLAIENGKTPVVRMLLDMEQVSYDKDIQFRMTRIDSDLKPDTDFSAMRFDVGLETADQHGVTPYMKAAALGHTAIFQMIAQQHLCDGLDNHGRSWISHAIENRREALLVEILDEVNAQILQLPPNHSSGYRITPRLISQTDVWGHLPLPYARELGLTAVAERIEAYCRLTIEKCDRDQAVSPTYEVFNNTTRELCQRALGESNSLPGDFGSGGVADE